jgi:uncharacterized protein (DUF2141 family)
MRQKRNIFSTTAAFIAAWGLTVGAMAAEKGDLTIRVDSLRNDKGEVMVALSRKSTPNINPADMIASDRQKSSTDGITFVLKDIPNGMYYIYMIHDENGNKRLDSSDHIPQEGLAYYPGKRSTPKVKIAGKNTEAKLMMIYIADRMKNRK